MFSQDSKSEIDNLYDLFYFLILWLHIFCRAEYTSLFILLSLGTFCLHHQLNGIGVTKSGLYNLHPYYVALCKCRDSGCPATNIASWHLRLPLSFPRLVLWGRAGDCLWRHVHPALVEKSVLMFEDSGQSRIWTRSCPLSHLWPLIYVCLPASLQLLTTSMP